MERKRGTTGKITNGRIVDALRKHSKLTFQKLAKQVGLNSASTCSAYAPGRFPFPPTSTG